MREQRQRESTLGLSFWMVLFIIVMGTAVYVYNTTLGDWVKPLQAVCDTYIIEVTAGPAKKGYFEVIRLNTDEDVDAIEFTEGMATWVANNSDCGLTTDSIVSTFVTLSTDQTITGVKTWNTTVGNVPFIVDASDNSVVTNLNADLLGGYSGAAFAALAEAEVITGAWDFTTPSGYPDIPGNNADVMIINSDGEDGSVYLGAGLTNEATRVGWIGDADTGWIYGHYEDFYTPTDYYAYVMVGGLQVGGDDDAPFDNAQDGEFTIHSEQGATDYRVRFGPHAAMTMNTDYLWPPDDGDAREALISDGSGNLSWDTTLDSLEVGANESVNGVITLYSLGAGETDPTIAVEADGDFVQTAGSGDFIIESTADAVKIQTVSDGNTIIGGDLFLELSATADYKVQSRAGGDNLTLENTVSGENAIAELFAADGDGTDYVGFRAFGVGTVAASADHERISLWWNQPNAQYEIVSEVGGTGTLRPIAIYTEGNTAQLQLATDGNVGIKDADPDAVLDVIGDAFFGDDGTNYAEIKNDGEINLHGTARVTKAIDMAGATFAIGKNTPTGTTVGTYLVWEYDINDGSALTFEMPHDWASATDVVVKIDWAINEAYGAKNGEVQFNVAWSACPHNTSEALDGPTHTGTLDPGDINIPATANFLTRTTAGTISGASLSVEDEIGLLITREALDGGANPTATPYITHLYIEYMADKLGEAT